VNESSELDDALRPLCGVKYLGMARELANGEDDSGMAGR
jgi:hypothetical protein